MTTHPKTSDDIDDPGLAILKLAEQIQHLATRPDVRSGSEARDKLDAATDALTEAQHAVDRTAEPIASTVDVEVKLPWPALGGLCGITLISRCTLESQFRPALAWLVSEQRADRQPSLHDAAAKLLNKALLTAADAAEFWHSLWPLDIAALNRSDKARGEFWTAFVNACWCAWYAYREDLRTSDAEDRRRKEADNARFANMLRSF